MTDWKQVGGRIRDARKRAGMTGAQLGAAAGIGDAGRVSTLESGTKPATEENLAKVAQVLGVSLPYLRYGLATAEDAERLRTAGFSDGWRAAIDQLAAAATALQSAPPGTPLTQVVLPEVGVGPFARTAAAGPSEREDGEDGEDGTAAAVLRAVDATPSGVPPSGAGGGSGTGAATRPPAPAASPRSRRDRRAG